MLCDSMEDFIKKYPNVISRTCSHFCGMFAKYGDTLKEKLSNIDDASEKVCLLCDEVGCEDVTPLVTFLNLLQETHGDGDDVCFSEPLKRLESHQRAKMTTQFLPLSEECTSHSPSRMMPGRIKHLSGFEEVEVLNVAIAISLTAFYVDESPLTSPVDLEPPDTSWEA